MTDCTAVPPDSGQSAPSYRAPPWLPGGHLQTLWAVMLARPCVDYRRDRWELPDGDFIDLDWVDGPADAPLLVLFHGLEGNSGSHYARQLMAEARQRGWRGVVPHFRGCSGEPNRLPRAYFAGDADEIGTILGRLREAESAPMRVVGVSLGGNALLRWAAREGEAARVAAARMVAVSAPLDLPAAGAALDRGFTRVYAANFLSNKRRAAPSLLVPLGGRAGRCPALGALSTLKPKALAKLEHYPHLYDRRAVASVDSIHGFDTLVTAPLHGYRDADDYWRQAASKPVLRDLRVDTLLLNARNDPFMPGDVLPGPDQVSEHVVLDFSEEGGHVGFVSGPFPGNFLWLRRRVLDFLAMETSQVPPWMAG